MEDNLQRAPQRVPQRGPLISAGVFLGIGLGGFVDGIVFHQILQVHNMLSNRIPPTNLIAAKVNMTWDGYFHAGVWMLTVTGLYLLFRAGQRQDVPWSGKILLGSMIGGWGLFNLVEGIIDHHLLGLHHVMEYTSNPLPYDLAFLGSGLIFLLFGWAFIRAGRHVTYTRGKG
jgi:uncharacterized membrane protein